MSLHTHQRTHKHTLTLAHTDTSTSAICPAPALRVVFERYQGSSRLSILNLTNYLMKHLTIIYAVNNSYLWNGNYQAIPVTPCGVLRNISRVIV